MCIFGAPAHSTGCSLQGSRSPSVFHRVSGGRRQTPTRRDCCELLKLIAKVPVISGFSCRLYSAGVFGRWRPPDFVHFYWRVSLAGGQTLAAGMTLPGKFLTMTALQVWSYLWGEQAKLLVNIKLFEGTQPCVHEGLRKITISQVIGRCNQHNSG